MSQRIKRLTKKIQKMSENYEREAVINNVIDEANQAIKAFTEIIQVGNKELDDIHIHEKGVLKKNLEFHKDQTLLIIVMKRKLF